MANIGQVRPHAVTHVIHIFIILRLVLTRLDESLAKYLRG
jgi:hypothetical protein